MWPELHAADSNERYRSCSALHSPGSVPQEAVMKKGKNRRYREAREFKQADHLEPLEELLNGPTLVPSEPCVECQRIPHAQWCMVDTQ